MHVRKLPESACGRGRSRLGAFVFAQLYPERLVFFLVNVCVRLSRNVHTGRTEISSADRVQMNDVFNFNEPSTIGSLHDRQRIRFAFASTRHDVCRVLYIFLRFQQSSHKTISWNPFQKWDFHDRAEFVRWLNTKNYKLLA